MRIFVTAGSTFAITSLFFAAAALSSGTHGSHGTAAGHPGNPKKVSRTITIEMSEYSYGQSALDFKAGETVKFVLINKGKLKHEMTIGTEAEQLAHRKEMQSMSDMGHSHDAHEMPPNAVHLNPGETRELVWQFSGPATLQFACNYPGHADLGMQGSITVK